MPAGSLALDGNRSGPEICMKKILIVFSHSEFVKSRINKAMLTAIRDLENVTVHILEESGPNFKFDIAKEQALLEAHDVIVLQFPMYWYSCPAVMKLWIDEVMQYGWAFGSTGTALKGKTLVCASSQGGSAEDFTATGDYQYSVEEFYRPFEITAKFCKMAYDEPFLIFDTSHITDAELERSAADYRSWLKSL